MRFAILHASSNRGHPDTTVYDREFASEEEAIRQFESDYPGRVIIRIKEA